MRKIFSNYIANFKGLSKEIWLLSVVTLINRAGAMVIPFLSLYLVNAKGFSLPQVGMIMTCFGLGSLTGTWIGGKLTDIIGFYKVIVLSLFLGGVGFILLQFIDTYYGFCIGIFLLIFVADAYRPAIFVAADSYSKPGNFTRSITLIRLAVNLGFSIGPLLGGIIIASINYDALFWIDGISCILAASGLVFWLKPKKQEEKQQDDKSTEKQGISPYKSAVYMLFILIMIIYGTNFVQYYSVVPLYYEEVHLLSEDLIGWLMFLNGALIVVFEMPLIGWLERKKMSKTIATFLGIFFLALGFLVFNLSSWVGILVIGMILNTLGEMIGSPFSNALALEMAPQGRKGSYMGLYSMSFSFAHIIGHNGGMNMVNWFGYDTTWYLVTILLFATGLATLWLYRILKTSKKYTTY